MTRARAALAAAIVVSLGARGVSGQPLSAAQASADPAPTGATAAPTTSPPAPPLSATPPHLFLHIRSKSHLTTDGGSSLDLPPGYFLDEPGWTALDDEMKSLQDDKTRLTAENKSMRSTLSSWQPGWKVLVTTLVVGVVGGWALHEAL